MARTRQTLKAALLPAALTAAPAFIQTAPWRQDDSGPLFHLTGDKGLRTEVVGGRTAPLLKPKIVQVGLKVVWKNGCRLRIVPSARRRAGNHPAQQYRHRPLI